MVLWLVVVLGAAGYAALNATGQVGGGDLPGEGAPGQRAVALLAICALLLGSSLLLLAGLADSPRIRGRAARPLPSVPVAAALFLVAHWLSFDPYYAPVRRRFADAGAVPAEVVIGLAAVAVLVAAALLPRRSRRPAAVACGALLAAVAFAAVIAGSGH